MKSDSGALRHFGRIKNGTTPASGEANYWDGEVLWATPEDLGKLTSDRISHTKRQVTEKAVAECNLSVLPAGSVIISTRAPIGHMAINEMPMAFNQGCRGIMPGDQVDGPFLYYLLKSRVPALNAIANGTTFVELSRDELAAVPVEFPPLDTQWRIARFLDEKTARIDGLIEKKRALLDRLAEKRQALITRAVTKGLNPDAPMKPSGIDWLGDIPGHWEVLRLRYAVKNLNNMRIPIAAEMRKGVERTYPYYGASGIIDYVDEYIFDFPTVLVAEDGANLLSRTTPLSFIAEGKYWVNNHAHILRPEKTTIWFCSSLLALYPLDPWISGSAQPKLTKDNLGSLKVWVPPLDEQRQIEASVKVEAAQLQHARQPLEKSIEAFEEYRSAVITAAVTGQLAELR